MRNVKRIICFALALTMILSGSMVFAATGDVFVKATNQFYASSDQIVLNDDLAYPVVLNDDQYKYELNGKFYELTDLNDAFAQDPENFLTLLENNYTPIGPVEPVTEQWEIKLTPLEEEIEATNNDNTSIKIEVVDDSGNVVPVNNVVVELLSSHGNISPARATLQNGVGYALLTSEHSATPLICEITAKLFEAGQDVKDKIGQTQFFGYVYFVPIGGELDEAKIPPRLVNAESGQADRITLYFNKEVNVDEMWELMSDIQITQWYSNPTAIRLLPVEGNNKAAELLIDIEDAWGTDILEDNTYTTVTYILNTVFGPLTESKSFILNDSRKPELVGVDSVDGMVGLRLEFSEAILEVDDIIIDGGIVDVDDWYYNDYDIVLGDVRHFVDVEIDGWLEAGWHSITIIDAADFAWLSDEANISTTQTLEFYVEPNEARPTVSITVESPEQFRIKAVDNMKIAAVGGLDYGTDWAIQYNNGTTAAPDWVPLTNGVVTEVVENEEYVVETTNDWTDHFDTTGNNVNYYNKDYRLYVNAGVLINLANGLTNNVMELTMKYLGSPLNTEDTTSPRLVEVKQVDDFVFNVIMDEPVKGRGLDPVGDTPSQEQGATIPEIVVEFIGKDSSGNVVTLNGAVLGYGDSNEADKIISVTAPTSPSALQVLVDEHGYSEEWILNVKNITDDIGNAAETVVYPFTVPKTPVDPGEPDNYKFWIESIELNYGDEITVKFTDFIKFTGQLESAIYEGNYSVDNKKLPNGSNIIVDTSSYQEIYGKKYYDTIIILLAEDLDYDYEHTLEVAKTLKSQDGDEFLGFKYAYNGAENGEKEQYQAVINPDPWGDFGNP